SKIGDPSICPTAVLVKDKSVLLGFRNYTPDKWKTVSVWTTPGGRCDTGETVEQTLRREIKEEINITNVNIIDIIAEIPGAKEGDVVTIFYCTTDQEPKLMEPEKFSEWKWVLIEEYLSGAPYDSMNPTAHRLISNFLKEKLTEIGTGAT
ncbi:MAG: NUDIX hydrolase, partial [Patescibacteria group bacterium]